MRVFEHELNEYKSVQVTRILHDFYDADPKRGFYGGGGIDARINPQPASWALRAAATCRAGARTSRRASKRFRAAMVSTGHTTSLPLEIEQRQHRSRRSRMPGAFPAIRVTYKDHPDDLAMAQVPAGPLVRNHAGGRRAEDLAR